MDLFFGIVTVSSEGLDAWPNGLVFTHVPFRLSVSADRFVTANLMNVVLMIDCLTVELPSICGSGSRLEILPKATDVSNARLYDQVRAKDSQTLGD